MFKILQYLKFLLTSTNEHGVHSPFVYNYVTKCLYSAPHFRHSKSVNIILKSITYFDAKQVWLPENRKLEKIVRNHFPDMRFVDWFSEILFLSASNITVLNTLLHEEEGIQNDSLLLINAIYANKSNKAIWNSIKKHEKVRVTVDMFHCGAAFFRKEQAKEHFKIRI